VPWLKSPGYYCVFAKSIVTTSVDLSLFFLFLTGQQCYAVILICQALLAYAPATLSATENQEKPANNVNLNLLYKYSVNDSVNVDFLPSTNN
jgi:hypothetical protein